METEPNITFTNKLELASYGVSRINITVNAFRFSFSINNLTGVGVDHDRQRLIVSCSSPDECPHHIFSIPDCDIEYEFKKARLEVKNAEKRLKKAFILSDLSLPAQGNRHNQPRTLNNVLVLSDQEYKIVPEVYFNGSEVKFPNEQKRKLKPNEHIITKSGFYLSSQIEAIQAKILQNGGVIKPLCYRTLPGEWHDHLSPYPNSIQQFPN